MVAGSSPAQSIFLLQVGHNGEDKGTPLGDFFPAAKKFQNVPQVLKDFRTDGFRSLNHHRQQQEISQALFALIDATPSPCFLLPAVIDYIDQVNAMGEFEPFFFHHFELWLNQFSGVDGEKNYEIRGKLCGKGIPRDAYQSMFPIGMGKRYPGSHFVTAHASPDLDTTVASFWGWVDAFGARVADGLHLWNVPGGPPASSIEIDLLFYQWFGESVFSHLAKTRSGLALSGMELMTQNGYFPAKASDSILSSLSEQAVVLTDDEGYYLGDWHSLDSEGVRQIIILFHHCLRAVETQLHAKLISFFGKERFSKKELPLVFSGNFGNTVRAVFA